MVTASRNWERGRGWEKSKDFDKDLMTAVTVFRQWPLYAD